MPEFRYTSDVSTRTGSSFSYYSSYDFLQRKRTLDEFPMEHKCEDVARLSAARRQEKEARRRSIVSTCGESQQLKSYSRKRFETALTVSGSSLPPPSPRENRIFWDEVTPSWARRRHYSVTASPTVVSSPVQLNARPGSEPPGSVAVRQKNGSGIVFNHLRGNNNMYPRIKRLLQESNEEYRVVSQLSTEQPLRFGRRPSSDYSVITDCYLVPLKPNIEPTIKEKTDIKLESEPEILSRPKQSDSEHADSVDEYAEPLGESFDVKKPTRSGIIPMKETVVENDDNIDDVGPSVPWRCWVDDATVSSIAPSPELEIPVDDITAPPSPAPDQIPDTTSPTPGADATSKTRLSLSVGKLQTKVSSASVEKRESLVSPSPEALKGKRKSSGRLKKKKGRKGTPEPSPPEVVELPPPPPPTPPVVEVVEEVVQEEEKVEEKEPVLPSYICPSSMAKSNDAEIKLWLKKSTFSAASRTLPIF